MHIGARIRGRRGEKGLSIEQLAEKTGIRADLLADIEREVVGAEKLSGRDVLHLARALDSSIEWTLHGTIPDVYVGPTVIVCRRGQPSHRCSQCGARAGIQCDYALTAKASRKTCDAWLCDRCAHTVGRDRHHCPAHYRLAKRQGVLPLEEKR